MNEELETLTQLYRLYGQREGLVASVELVHEMINEAIRTAPDQTSKLLVASTLLLLSDTLLTSSKEIGKQIDAIMLPGEESWTS